MSFSLFLANRIYSSPTDKRKVSRPAIRTAIAGVAIGLAVMLITVSVVLGFKHTIQDKVIGFGSHIQIENFLTMQSTDPYPITVNDSLLKVIKKIKGVAHTERFALTQGILKTDDNFLGITFKGIAQDYDPHFLHAHLLKGTIPSFSDKKSSRQLLVSKMVADQLNIDVGKQLFAYFITQGEVRVRKFTVCGIYETNLSQFDRMLCFTDLYTTVRLNKWEADQCTGIQLSVADFSRLELTAANVVAQVNRTTDHEGNTLMSQTIHEAYPQIFSWLELLDINVWIILILMICVAGFTMISGLLIIILERTQMIGILKALGARNLTIRHTFLWFSAMIISRGLLWGNAIGLGLIFLQQYIGIISLDPATYYVSEAPVEINWLYVLLLNLSTLLISLLVLIGPSFLVSHISPVKSMRYE